MGMVLKKKSAGLLLKESYNGWGPSSTTQVYAPGHYMRVAWEIKRMKLIGR